MKDRTVWPWVVGALVVVIGIVAWLRGPARARERGQPMPAPAQTLAIDFDKRYHLLCLFGTEVREYRDCKILGFSTEGHNGLVLGRMQFNQWLAVELGDGRRMYLPPYHICGLEEAAVRPE